jgi:hypothetical protein
MRSAFYSTPFSLSAIEKRKLFLHKYYIEQEKGEGVMISSPISFDEVFTGYRQSSDVEEGENG